jgi:hypothetical protein
VAGYEKAAIISQKIRKIEYKLNQKWEKNQC